jgi:hypothetical protein
VNRELKVLLKIAEKLGLSRGSELDCTVRTVQRALSQAGETGLGRIIEALVAIIEKQGWRARLNQFGAPFESFAEFVVGASPNGLGVQSLEALKMLRELLLDLGYYREWVELMEFTMRRQGRPRKTHAYDEGFERFYSPPTAQTARDQMLLVLKRRHPEAFAALCQSKGSIRAAAIAAGVIRPRADAGRCFGVCDLEGVRRLSARSKRRLFRKIFDALGLDDQCTSIKSPEPVLGPDLARRWRAHATGQFSNNRERDPSDC